MLSYDIVKPSTPLAVALLLVTKALVELYQKNPTSFNEASLFTTVMFDACKNEYPDQVLYRAMLRSRVRLIPEVPSCTLNLLKKSHVSDPLMRNASKPL